MALTLAPSDAFNFAKTYIKALKLDDVNIRILDDVNKYMWMAAPWRWTLGSTPAVNLIANQQDYTISTPGDLMYLQSAYVSDGSTPPRPIIVEPSIPTTSKYTGQPNRVALIGSNTLRIVPVPTGFAGNLTNTLLGLYKKHAPTITNANYTTLGVQIFDDEYFWVYLEGVLWRAYLYADDERAGNVTYSDGKTQYTGQRAAFEAGLQFMRQVERLHQEERPKEP